MGYHSEVILSGRRINDGMGKYIAENTVKQLIRAEKNVKRAKVAIFGFTFKENCQDTRNTKVYDIVQELREYEIEPVISDPVADVAEARRLYGVELVPPAAIRDMDAIIVAVAHDAFRTLGLDKLGACYGEGHPVLIDVKGVFDRATALNDGYAYWRL